MTRPWYEDLFDDDYVRGYSRHDAERAEHEATAIWTILDLKPGERVLDLPCGAARHALLLRARGAKVSGVDLSSVMLGEAARAGARCVACGDMRRLPLREAVFDAAYNVFTSIGYFEDDRDNLEVFREVHRVLRPGGRFFVDTINRDALFAPRFPFPRRMWTRGKGLYMLDEIDFDTVRSRFRTHRIFLRDDGTRREVDFSLRAYASHELAALLDEAGFALDRFLAGFNPDTAFDPQLHFRLAALAFRR
jgi:SAM-dependent methyltransferase